MNCARIEVMLPDHAMRRLPAGQSVDVQAHLEQCTACSIYLNQIEELYELPLPFMGTPPVALKLETRGAGIRQLAFFGSALAAALLLYFSWPTGESEPGPENAQRPRVGQASLSIELPELPKARALAGWLDSESEAQLLSEYSGKPLLLQYINAECQRCLGVVKLLEDPQLELLLDEFVCFRSEVEQDSPPSVLEGRVPQGMLMLSLPAMFVRDESCSTDPAMAISNWDDVESVVAEYATQCEVRNIEIVRALEGHAFDQTLEQMRALPKLMEAGSYNRVLADLEQMSGLGKRYRTRFAREALRMQSELMHELESMLCDLEELRAMGEAEQVQALAQNLMPGLSDTPFEGRIQLLCN